MDFLTLTRIRNLGPWVLLLWVCVVVWTGLRQPLPPHPSTTIGLPAVADFLLTLAVWTHLVLLGVALGKRVLGMFHPSWYAPEESWIWALPTGLTLLGYPVYALGMMGLFQRKWLALLLLLLTVWLRKEMYISLREGFALLYTKGTQWRKAPLWAKVGWALVTFLMGSAFLLALTPPTEYDALWYHLQAPRLFLQAGRIYPEWNNWPANYAFAVNMLYALPMALGTDTAPKLLHWTFALALLLIAYFLARPYAGQWAWVAPGFVFTSFSFATRLASSSLTDVSAAALELMAYVAAVRFWEKGERFWLYGMGLWTGLAVSTKLSALPLVLIFLFLLFLAQLANKRVEFSEKWRALFLFLTLALPWYGKNWLWFGTPLFPMHWKGQVEEIALRASLFRAYVNASRFQGGERFWLLLWMLIDPQRLDFTTPPLASYGILGLFFLPLSSWVRMIMMLAIARMLLWTLGPPGIRFLLAAFSLWGVVIAVQVSRFLFDLRVYYRILARVLLNIVVLFLTFAALEMALVIKDRAPWRVVLGLESRAHYLRHYLDGFKGWEFVTAHLLSAKPKLLLIGDARHYYCPGVCDPEADQFTWTRMAIQARFDLEAVLKQLQARRITHLWIHKSSMQWLLDHDVRGWVRQSYVFLTQQVVPRCGRILYEDEEVTIVRLSCLAKP